MRSIKGQIRMSIGQIGSSVPLSRDFGLDRGLPVDRHYIESFLADHASDIRGRVLEVGDDSYSRRFGGGRIEEQDILHVHPGNPMATLVGDITDAAVLPSATFDCVILTQTLHLIFDMSAAIAQIHRSLKPGGVALITVPGITPIDRYEWGSSWYWSLTPLALERLLGRVFGPDHVGISAYGNLYSATAFLHGAAFEEVSRAKLAPYDSSYPVIAAARAQA